MNASARNTFILLACTILGVAKAAPADTLYLKNGMYIVVARATEKDGQIDYWVGSTKYTISKDLVAKIESGNGPSPSVHSATPIDSGAHGDTRPQLTANLTRTPPTPDIPNSRCPSQADPGKTSLTGLPCATASCKATASTR